VVLAFFDKRHFTRSLIAVVFASVWAGISRVNWFPVPAVLAIALYVLETPYSQIRNFWRYFFRPIVFTAAGLGSALAAQFIYIQLSGQPNQASFGSSFTADLLWNRLLPSPTYGPGILPMTLLLSIPVLILLIANLGGQRLHFWRLAALFAMTALLLGGGLVVSTKIGGGSNLHNLDSYLVLLAVWSSYLLAGRIETESSPSQFWKPAWLLAAIVILPLVPNLMSGQAYPQYDFGSAQAELNTLRQQVEKASQSGGRVLFIAERQLVTFHQVNVPMQPGFETLELMEWAISNNQPMLGTFYESLHRHDYALIVAQSQRTEFKDAENGFPEENNAWVTKITLPLLKEYQPILTLPKSDIQVFAPIP
jgi:hypothetical protein